jgi:hypothetical protein
MVLLESGSRIKMAEVQRDILENGVAIITLSPEKNGLEFDKRSPLYIGVLRLVSGWAMLTNITQALYAKLFKARKISLKKILWFIGRSQDHISSFAVDRFSRFNHQAKYGAAGWRSLDLFYNYWAKIEPQLNSNLEGWLTRYWIEKMENRQAVTNRRKVVTHLLAKAFAKFVNEPEVRLVSVASGSAQAVVMAIKKSSQNVRVILIDVDPSAIEKAKETVREAGLEDRFFFVCASTSALEKICGEFQPHIIEMVGFLDYRPKKEAINLVSRIRNCLPEGGIFLTCNIRRNREKAFLDWVLLWPMIYRDERQLAEILIEGGFSQENIEIIYEPFRIHGIGICRK